MKIKEEVKVHKASRPKFECTRCHRTYPSTLDLEEHIRSTIKPAQPFLADIFQSSSYKKLSEYANGYFLDLC